MSNRLQIEYENKILWTLEHHIYYRYAYRALSLTCFAYKPTSRLRLPPSSSLIRVYVTVQSVSPYVDIHEKVHSAMSHRATHIEIHLKKTK